MSPALSSRDHYNRNYLQHYHLHHHHHHYHHHHNQLHRKRKTSHCRLTRTNSVRSDTTYKTRNSVNSNNNNSRCSRLLKHCVEWFCNKIGSTQSHHHPHHPTSTAANTSPPSIGGSTNTGLHNEFETIADAQEALWFVRENIEKKKRVGESSNPKEARRSIRDPTKERTYTKYPSEIDLFQYRRQQQLYQNNNQYQSSTVDYQYIDHHHDSVDYYNHSLLPICSGNNGSVLNGPISSRTSQNGGSTTTGRATLRRSRSLAVTREDIYTDLKNQNLRTQKQLESTAASSTSGKNRRSQLIPRARLIDKGSFKERPTYQNLERSTIKRASCRSNSVTDYYQGVNENHIIPVPQKLEKLQTVLSSWPETHNIIQTYPQINKKEAQILDSNSTTNDTSSNNEFDDQDDYINHGNNTSTHALIAGRKSHNPSEIDSLDSNFQNKSSTSYICVDEDQYNDSSDELEKPGNNLGLPLPNYYPDSVYDTDLSLTHCHNSTFDLDEPPAQHTERVLPEINVTSYDSAGEKEANIDEEFEVTSKAYQTDSSTLTISDEFNSFVEIPLNNEPPKELVYTQLEFKPKVVGTEVKKPIEQTYDQLQPKKSEPPHNKIKNFINKNIISVFHSEQSTKRNKTDDTPRASASENQYYSLPDVTICKSLRKCARIDAKLRQIDSTENRFVVNIGPQIIDTEEEISSVSVQPEEQQHQVLSVPIEIATKCKISTEKLDGQSGASSLDINLDTFHDEINVNSLINANNTDKVTIQVAGSNTEENKDNDNQVQETHHIEETPSEISIAEENQLKKLRGKSKNQDSFKLYCARSEIKVNSEDKKPNESGKTNDKNCAMPRPQIINIIKDAKQSPIHHNSVVTLSNDTLKNTYSNIIENNNTTNPVTHKQDNVTIVESSPTPIASSSSPQEYEEKVNTVKTYWDKMIDKCDVDTKKMGQTESSTKPKITQEIPKKVEEPNVKIIECNLPKKIEVPTINIENVRKIFESNGSNEEPVEQTPTVSQVEQCRKLFEPTPEIDQSAEDSRMGAFVKESCSFFEKAYGTLKKSLTRVNESEETCEDKENYYDSINYNLEIVDTNEKNNEDKSESKEKPKEHVIVRRTKSAEEEQEFDHIRYKVMKSNLFQKSIYSTSKKEAQFDGLLQYLQDYSFQELLVNNNVVIIEPVRTKFERDESKANQTKISRPASTNSLPHRKISIVNESAQKDDDDKQKKSNLKKHFFYHPIRVNRELIEEELPDPETVRKVRTFFEKEFGDESTIAKKLTKSQSTKNLSETKPKPRKRILRYLTVDTNYGNKWDSGSLSSGVSSGGSELCCDELSPKSNDNLFSSEENVCDPDLQYDASVSQDVLKKIRECGTTITYYGGKVVNAQNGPLSSPMKSIMDEIKQNNKSTKKQGRTSTLEIKKRQQVPSSITEITTSKTDDNEINSPYQGIRFKLVKSNSCSSRLELIGATTNEKPSKYLQKRKSCNDVKPLANKETDSFKSTEFIEKTQQNKINENNNNNNKPLSKNLNQLKEFSPPNPNTKFGEMIFEEFEVAESLNQKNN